MTALPAKGLNGWHILAVFVGFFAIVIGADITFAVLAYRSAPGQAAKDPYEAGLLYQRTLDTKAREAAFVPAIAGPYRDRSHFEAQDLMEHGGVVAGGWLGRYLRGRPAPLSAMRTSAVEFASEEPPTK